LEEVADQNPAVESGDVEIRRRGGLGGEAKPGDQDDRSKEEGVPELGVRGGELLAEGIGDDARKRGEEENERGAKDVGAEGDEFEHGDERRGGEGEEDAAGKIEEELQTRSRGGYRAMAGKVWTLRRAYSSRSWWTMGKSFSGSSSAGKGFRVGKLVPKDTAESLVPCTAPAGCDRGAPKILLLINLDCLAYEKF